MTKLTCAVLILAACSKAKEPEPAPKAVEPTPTTPAPTTPSVTKAPPKKDAPACPQGDALAAKIAKLYGVAAVTDAVCAAGHFPQPAWMIHARYDSKDPDDGMVTERLAMVDPDGKIGFDDASDIPPGHADSSGLTAFQLVDFDGDGIDELVWVAASDRRGYSSQTLVVQKWVKDKWAPAFDRQFEYDNTAAEASPAVSCEATWKIAGDAGKRTIVFEPKTKDKHDECVKTKETWLLGTDGKFAKAK